MKKLIVYSLIALSGMFAQASSAYHVYKIQIVAQTTCGKGMATSKCGEEFAYRDRTKVKICGILAGCGCGAIEANGNCKNAILYLWDETRKQPITNVDGSEVPWTVYRIGKSLNCVEHYTKINAVYGANDEYKFDCYMSGFGSYAEDKKCVDQSYVKSISGNVAGIASAPQYFIKGYCTACSFREDQVIPTTAIAVCESCTEMFTGEEASTPFFGSYKVVYDSGRSSKISKNGLNAKDLGLPSYVGIDDYVATNIGIED